MKIKTEVTNLAAKAWGELKQSPKNWIDFAQRKKIVFTKLQAMSLLVCYFGVQSRMTSK